MLAPVRPAVPRSSQRVRGAAIVTVLLIVTLATVVVSSLFWREHVAVRSVENRLALAQTRWMERGAIDYARLVLTYDRRLGTVDHVGEVWAIPIQPSQLDETITGGARLDDRAHTPAVLSGQIQDAQGRMNLNNLVVNGQVDAFEAEAFQRLLILLGRPPGLAENLVERLLRAQPHRAGGATAAAGAASPVGAASPTGAAAATAAGAAGAAPGQQLVLPTAIRMKRLADLLEVPGFDPDTVQLLDPFVIFLPVSAERTLVNINTASAEVIAARVPQLEGNAALARAFVDRRDRQLYFRSLGEAGSQLPNVTAGLPAERWKVSSDFFLLRGVIRFERVVSRTDTLLSRRSVAPNPGGTGQNVEVVWQDRY